MTDYDSDSSDGREQPRMVEVSAAEWERMQAQLAAAREALEAARTLAWKMDQIQNSNAYESVWHLAANHGMPYSGETWTEEYHDLVAALAAMEEKP